MAGKLLWGHDVKIRDVLLERVDLAVRGGLFGPKLRGGQARQAGGGVVAKLIENVSEVLEGELVHEQGLGIIARDDGEVSTGPGGCVVDGLIAGEVLGQHGDVVALTTVAAGENECGVETDDAGSGREELAE